MSPAIDYKPRSTLIDIIGVTLLRKLRAAALRDRAIYNCLFDEFSVSLSSKHVDNWEKMVSEFEKDSTQPDPYYVVPTGQSFLVPR